MGNILGIDVGGTKILVGLLDENAKIILSQKYPMKRKTQQQASDTIFNAIEDFFTLIKSQGYPMPCSIGMGTVGHIDHKNGIWLQSYNIPISVPIPVKEILENKYNIPTKLDNDVRCATLGEYHFGKGKSSSCMIYINVGTGIAAGIVHEGMLIRGADNYAGEIGFMHMNCESKNGILEPVASGGGLILEAEKALSIDNNSALAMLRQENKLHSTSIFDEAQKGDKLAITLTNRAVLFLGSAICNLMAIFNPDTIVLGGGVVRDSFFTKQVVEFVDKNSVGESKKALKYFDISDLNPEFIGLIGASSLHK